MSSTDDPLAGLDPKLREQIEAFKNRRIYTSLSAGDLASIPDGELDRAVVDLIFERAEDDGGKLPQVLATLSDGFSAIFYTWVVEAEVNNGGFNQYFWNWGALGPEDAVRGFELLGAATHAQVVRRALEVFAHLGDRWLRLYQDHSDKALTESYEDNPLNKLDEEFLGVDLDLHELRVQYIRQHPELFVAL